MSRRRHRHALSATAPTTSLMSAQVSSRSKMSSARLALPGSIRACAAQSMNLAAMSSHVSSRDGCPGAWSTRTVSRRPSVSTASTSTKPRLPELRVSSRGSLPAQRGSSCHGMRSSRSRICGRFTASSVNDQRRVLSVEDPRGERVLQAELALEPGLRMRIDQHPHPSGGMRHSRRARFSALSPRRCLSWSTAVHAAMRGIATGKAL